MGTSSSYSAPSTPAWRAAKNAASRYASGGGESGGRDPGVSVSRFIGALGGSRAAAQTASAARTVAAGLASFAQIASTRGLPAALREVGLTDAVGLPPDEILARLVDLLAMATATIDETAAREALLEVLRENIKEAVDIEDAFNLDANGLVKLISDFIVAYVFRRFVKALGRRFRDKSVSAEAAREREVEIRRYIADRVQFEMLDVDAIRMDWSTEGADLVGRLVLEAFQTLEELDHG